MDSYKVNRKKVLRDKQIEMSRARKYDKMEAYVPERARQISRRKPYEGLV